MSHKVSLAFDPQGFMLPLEQILPLRRLPPGAQASEKYNCILASIKEIGVIEPLIVFQANAGTRQHVLLDGTIRLDVLKALGEREAFCLRATEEEAFTYNHKVNQLSPIQEHFMVLKALDNGVPEARIAATLNVNVAAIRRKRDLLAGVCPETVALLKEKRISPAALREFKRVLPVRQVEMAELMIAANNFSASYAKCIFAGTPPDQRVDGDAGDTDRVFSRENMGRMQREMAGLHRDIKLVEETHGESCLHLVPAVGYLRKLLANTRVEKYLRSHHAEIHAEVLRIIAEPELGAST